MLLRGVENINTKILIAVAVVAIAAVGAVVYMNMDGDEEDDFSISGYPDTYMTVLGNANGDLVIDADDAAVIQQLIDSDSDYKYSKYYMYDANFDKKIDGKDVEKVNAIVAAQESGDWSAVGNVYYVNVDYDIASYDMTKGDKVITLIAPPLDTVLAIGGRDLVVGTDNRITTGKYHPEYASVFDFDNLIDVGDCKEPSTERITNASVKYGAVNVVCGTKDSYGPTMESTFKGTNVQVIRIASWEFGGTLYGLHTLGFLLKKVDGALDYYNQYMEIENEVQKIVKSVPGDKRSEGKVGAAAAYGYLDEISLLGEYTGEYANLMVLDPYDSGGKYLGGMSGGHGNTITEEGVIAMYQQHNLENLVLMVGTPFQVSAASGDAQSSAAYIKSIYSKWDRTIGLDTMPGLNMCIAGYSFSSGVSEVLNQMILCYYLYNEEFLFNFGFETQKQAQDKLAEYVDWYCQSIGIDDGWSFYGEENGGKAGTRGMNLLYCGVDDERNIMYGLKNGSI